MVTHLVVSNYLKKSDSSTNVISNMQTRLEFYDCVLDMERIFPDLASVVFFTVVARRAPMMVWLAVLEGSETFLAL